MYAFLRYRALKTFAQIKSTDEHNRRLKPIETAVYPGTHNKYEGLQGIMLPGQLPEKATLGEHYKHYLRAHDVDPSKLRKNGILAIEFVLGASPEYFRKDKSAAGTYELPKVEKWYAATKNWLNKQFPGKILQVTLHCDETTPHVHAIFVPLDDTPQLRGPRVRLNARRWLTGPTRGPNCPLVRWQSSYTASCSHLGLQRGAYESKEKHIHFADWKGYQQVLRELEARNAEAEETMRREHSARLAAVEAEKLKAEEAARQAKRLQEELAAKLKALADLGVPASQIQAKIGEAIPAKPVSAASSAGTKPALPPRHIKPNASILAMLARNKSM